MWYFSLKVGSRTKGKMIYNKKWGVMETTNITDVSVSYRVKVTSLTAVSPLERLADEDDCSRHSDISRSFETVTTVKVLMPAV